MTQKSITNSLETNEIEKYQQRQRIHKNNHMKLLNQKYKNGNFKKWNRFNSKMEMSVCEGLGKLED